MSFLNRTVIPAANGLTTLSIPLVGGRETKQVFKEVRIDNSQNWQTRHWRTISSAYRRSPWFEFYEPELMSIFEKHYEFLYEWNLDLLGWALKAIKSNVEIQTLVFRENDDLLTWEMKNKLKPSNFQSPEFIQHLPVYAQVFQDRIGFQPNVSIIDLIFNEGNKSRSLLVNTST